MGLSRAGLRLRMSKHQSVFFWRLQARRLKELEKRLDAKETECLSPVLVSFVGFEISGQLAKHRLKIVLVREGFEIIEGLQVGQRSGKDR